MIILAHDTIINFDDISTIYVSYKKTHYRIIARLKDGTEWILLDSDWTSPIVEPNKLLNDIASAYSKKMEVYNLSAREI